MKSQAPRSPAKAQVNGIVRYHRTEFPNLDQIPIKTMHHYKLTFLDRDDVHVDAEDMFDAMRQVPNHSLIGCEEIDVITGKTLAGIYKPPRTSEEQAQLLDQLILELQMLPAESPNREFLRGRLYGLQMAYLDDWECILNDDPRGDK
jgi:hypothetical protein